MQWRDAYKAQNMTCGNGPEFFFATGKKSLTKGEAFMSKMSLGPEFCARFYEKISESICVNVNMGEDQGQWCWVSSKCKSLAGGAAMPQTKLAWKQCSPRDKRLRDLTPEQLASKAVSLDLDLGLLHKMSYPLYKKALWGEVQHIWSPDTTATAALMMRAPMARSVAEELQVLKISG